MFPQTLMLRRFIWNKPEQSSSEPGRSQCSWFFQRSSVVSSAWGAALLAALLSRPSQAHSVWSWAASRPSDLLLSSSGGVLVLRPRAQDGDCEAGDAREGRGRHRHRRHLRDDHHEEEDDAFVLLLWLTTPCTTLTAGLPSRLSPPPFPPLPTILCFVAWLK